jgi:hypothetical protein
MNEPRLRVMCSWGFFYKIKNNTTIANLFNISTEMVEKARKMLPKK